VTTIAITSAAATAASSSSASSSTAPGINPFYTQTFSPQPRQEGLLRILQWHQEEEKRHEGEKKTARIAEFRERFEKARGFDEEDDEEFYPGVRKGKGKGGG
jgi:hypothetical protein